MLIIIASIVALSIAYLVTRERAGNSTLCEQHGVLLTVGIQIICGDCSGGDERPVKTYLDRNGNCAQCGGHSYMLASTRALFAQQVLMMASSDRYGASGDTRLEHVEVLSDLHTTQTRRLTA